MISRTIKELHGIFRDEWPEAERYPSHAELYPLAVRIGILKAIEAKKGNRPKPVRRRKSELVKAGENFLAELAKIGPWTDSGLPELVIFDRRDIALVEATRICIDLVLATFTTDQTDPARYLEEGVVQAWAQARVDVSLTKTKEETPLCQAVTRALELAGIDRAAETVSEHLRGREKRQRSGSSRNKGGR